MKQVCRAVDLSHSVAKSGVLFMVKSRFAAFLLLVAAGLAVGAEAGAAESTGRAPSVSVSETGGVGVPTASPFGDSGWS
ncbi:hypothetical protein [Streptomyces sp. NPDC057690]|uniref:hypothetical protein n=1 Tax=Streptomyces sp. NPDC057690 TaxID=3346214 RepID=UPI0036884069